MITVIGRPDGVLNPCRPNVSAALLATVVLPVWQRTGQASNDM
jgi:hypothetical protein